MGSASGSGRAGAAYDGLVTSRLAEEPSGLSVGLEGFARMPMTIASSSPARIREAPGMSPWSRAG
jgi:hypothetical protein